MTTNNPNDAIDEVLRGTTEEPNPTPREIHETACQTLDRLDEILEDANV
jgi:hypothetical protein